MLKDRVMLREGLIGESGNLLASKCKNCGQIFFPQRDRCLECNHTGLETIKLGTNGILYTFTIVQMPTEHFSPPYAIGWVECPEKVRVFGQIRGYVNKPLKIGMPMKIITDVLWQEEDKDIIAYKFEPLA